MLIRTDILIAENIWKKQPNIEKKIKSLVKKIIPLTPLFSISEKLKSVEVSILLTSDSYIQELNKNYREKNKPTNVLSFPLIDGKKIKNGNFKKLDLESKNLALGDIAISYQTMLRESLAEHKNFEDHLAHLLTHSLLHLIGFDHEESEKDAKIMEDLEVKILKNFGIKNPYKTI